MPPFVLLAFGFASPFLLWGLLLASVPLLIQWLHRRKYTERVWAAMRFLLAATESQHRRLRMESLLLLCVRTLILLLVVLALAEPFLESATWAPAPRTATHTLILLDASLSMQATVDGTPISERAKDAARSLVRSGKPGDSFQLLTIEARPRAVIRRPSFSVDEVLAEVDRLVTTESFGDVPEAIVRANRMLAEISAAGRKRVAVISDFQRANWQLDEPAAQERTRQALLQIGRNAAVSLVPVGDDRIENATVQEAHIESSLVAAGVPTTISAQVRNLGATPLRDQRLQLLEDGRVLATQRVTAPPRGEATVSFVSQWSETGPHALQLHLEDDPLAADNDRWVTVDVRDRLSVLLVNGRPSQQPLEGATDFVELALRPALSAGVDRAGSLRFSWDIEPTVISEAELIRTDLDEFDCVFVCDVPFLSDEEITRLEAFVSGGGGLVISMGDQVQLDRYSRQLTSDGGGLLPVQLGRVVGEASADAEPFRFAEPAAGHPLTDSFAGNPRSGLTTANILRYVEVRVPADSPVRTVLEFAHGAPAIVEHAYGNGRVILVATSLDDRWGSWALWPSFLPMMHELVEYVASGESTEPLRVGQPLHVELPDPNVLGQSVVLSRPDGRRSTLHPSYSDQSAAITVDDTSQSGIYRLDMGASDKASRLFAINVDTRESDLITLNDDELQSTVLGSIPFELANASVTPADASLPPSSESMLSRWLLVAVLVLLFVEQVMAWNGVYGVVALLVSPLLVIAFSVLPSASVIMLAAGLAALMYWRWKTRNVGPRQMRVTG